MAGLRRRRTDGFQPQHIILIPLGLIFISTFWAMVFGVLEWLGIITMVHH